jgi:hypothetical protein
MALWAGLLYVYALLQELDEQFPMAVQEMGLLLLGVTMDQGAGLLMIPRT